MSRHNSTQHLAPVRVLCLVLVSSLLGGCFLWTTRGEGDELDEKVVAHDQRIESLESGMTQERERLREEIERAETQVTKLQGIIESATRTGADIGASVAELQQRIQRLEGQTAEIRELAHTADLQVQAMKEELAQRIAELNSPGVRLDPNQIPQNKPDHFAAAQRELQREAYGMSRALFREYISRYADDEKSDDAQYFIGVSYLRESNFAGALGEFRKVLTNYPRGDTIDDTLLDMAEAFFQLNACTDAKAALNALIRSHRSSPLIRRARTKLGEIENAPAARCAS